MQIRDHFLIGNLHTAALVNSNASISWMCVPFFDSNSLFASILDKDAGEFKIESTDYACEARYLENLPIVSHNFTKDQESFSVYDFMVPKTDDYKKAQYLIRKIENQGEEKELLIKFSPKSMQDKLSLNFEFNKYNSCLEAEYNNIKLRLFIPKHCEISETKGEYLIKLRLEANSVEHLVLEWGEELNKNIDPEELYNNTVKFWTDWVAKGNYFDYSKGDLIRSAITLKLMQFYPTGALIAAPTTSLPEALGGNRNWDYRYSWVRDATFTIYAFNVLGYKEEAQMYLDYIHNIIDKHSVKKEDLRVMYTIWGEEVPEEIELENYSGYKESKPVRIGNDASSQLQIDAYGALIDAFYFVNKNTKESVKTWNPKIKKLIEQIESIWKEKDNGIWEYRTQEHFIYSKVMAWVGVNRALRLKKTLKLSKEEINKYQNLEKEIYNWLWEHGFNKEEGYFTQIADGRECDATNFLFVLLQFLDKSDPKTKDILQATEKHLVKDNIYTFRYLAEDGFKGDEGAFVLCTYWMISAYAIIGEVEKAEKIYTDFQKVINRQGLISEEISTKNNNYLGNYPQAFSHLGLIMAAYYLDRYKVLGNRD